VNVPDVRAFGDPPPEPFVEFELPPSIHPGPEAMAELNGERPRRGDPGEDWVREEPESGALTVS
jgi:hypothetical protein